MSTNNCNQIEVQQVVDGDSTTRQSVYFTQMAELIDRYSENVVIKPDISEAERLTVNYSTRAFNDVINIRRELSGVGPIANFDVLFPNLTRRLSQLPILTDAEILRFAESERISIFALPRLTLPINTENLLGQLDRFFSPSGTISGTAMGSFCSLVPNIFAQFDEFKGLFDNVMGYAQRAEQIIAMIQDQGAAGLVNQLRQQLLGAFDGIIENFKSQLMATTASFMQLPQMLSHNITSMFEQFRTLRDHAAAFLRTEVVQNMRGRLEGLVAQATSLFDLATFKIEEAQFLLLRFCEFIGNIEGFFEGLLQPIRDIETNFTNTFSAIQTSGLNHTARAVGAGAVRLTPAQREQGTTAAAQVPATPHVARSQTPSPPRAQGQPAGVRGNTLQPLRARHFQIQPPTPAEIQLVSEYTTLLDTTGNTPDISYVGRKTPGGGRNSWENVQLTEFVALIRLAKALGRRLQVNSAYRGYGVTQNTRTGRRTIYGYHTSGQAFDVSMAGFGASDRQSFNDAARRQGFGPTRFYSGSNFTHIDSGPPRDW